MQEKDIKFGLKVYSIFVRSLLIPIIIAMLCFFAYTAKSIQEREERNMQSVLSSVSQNVELQILEIENIRNAFYIHSEVFQEAEALNNPNLYAYYNNLFMIEIEKAYTMTLTKLMHVSTQKIRSVVLFPVSEGDTAYYLGKDSADLQAIEYRGYHRELWFQKTLNYPDQVVYLGPHIPDYMVNKRLGEVYSYISTVKSVDTNKVIGIVKIDVDIGQLQETLDTPLKSRDIGLMLLYDGNILVKSRNLPDSQEILNDGKVQLNSREFGMMTMEIADTGIEIIYLSSLKSQYKGYFYMIVLAILIMLAGVVLAFVNYRHQAGKMVQDVQQITDVVLKVERGELNSYIQIREDSEFKKIAEIINQMIDNLRTYIEKEYILVIQRQKAEYRALQSQINPHFLYNTLNGFVALNRMGEKKILEQSIVGLSKLFRYVCSTQETVTVREELDFLEEYLRLEKLKYEERLTYLIWVDEDLHQMQIPKLLLQPIVENSINHGRGDTDRAIHICIFATCVETKGIGKVMMLSVRDNGVGFSKEKISGAQKHVGIDNVRMRAELYCKNVIYQCVSKPEKGTKTTFVFPMEEGEV